ncbi:MAG: hypothetical protein AAF223_16875, partial [Bacteroidota bacterium]
VFVNMAYKVDLGGCLEQMCTSIELEISSRPPLSKGFVPVKIRWVREQTFGILNFQRKLDKEHEKTANSDEAWIYWRIVKEFSIGWPLTP